MRLGLLLGCLSALLLGPSAWAAEPAVPPALNAQDAETYFDGMIPYAMAQGDIAGAVVVVVKDGHVLLQKGYGYADLARARPLDPALTLVRPGSISKLFTWTAVMQLAEAGKLDLDRDVQAYLDFPLPRTYDQPVTLRMLMTHTAGYEETGKFLFAPDAASALPLKDVIRRMRPKQIFKPGTVVAYSNYGAGLAGYVVERVAGQPFEVYVGQHILAPLGMTRSSFRQPPPGGLARDLAGSYVSASRAPIPFEIVGPSPAGALSATGADMARFMIAHLGDGRDGEPRILRPETLQRMHAAAFRPVPPLNGMALGFYQEDRNGQRIVGHAGDTRAFHSDLHLLLDQHVGIFVSLVGGAGEAPRLLRRQLLRGFVDRYFPATSPVEPTLLTAKAHGRAIAGLYETSRRGESSFLGLASLVSQAKVKVGNDGIVTVSAFKDPNGRVKRWREVAPFVWRELAGPARLAVQRDRQGRILGLRSDDNPPISVYQPAPAWRSAGWSLPVLAAAALVLLLTALAWPASVVVRAAYRQPFRLSGARAALHRFSHIAGIVAIVAMVAWMVLLAQVSEDSALMNPGLDPWLGLLTSLGLFVALGAVGASWKAVLAWRDAAAPWRDRIGSTLAAGALAYVVWFFLAQRLITTSFAY